MYPGVRKAAEREDHPHQEASVGVPHGTGRELLQLLAGPVLDQLKKGLEDESAVSLNHLEDASAVYHQEFEAFNLVRPYANSSMLSVACLHASPHSSVAYAWFKVLLLASSNKLFPCTSACSTGGTSSLRRSSPASAVAESSCF